MYYLIIICLLWVLFVFQMIKERRSIFIGVTFLVASFLTFWGLVIITQNYPDQVLSQIVYLVGIGVIIILSLVPIMVLGSFFYSGIMLLKREGFRISNILSLTCGVLLLGYMIGWPFISRIESGPRTLGNYVYIHIGGIILYLFAVSAVYTLASWLNTLHFLPRKYESIIVLGAGLVNDKVTPLLAGRIKKAIKLHRKSPGSILIMSGGQGEDEGISEAQAMCEFAVEQGVQLESILCENESINTEENIRFSKRLIPPSHRRVAIVTNYYHLFRALLLTKKESLKCNGFGTRTKFYFSINAFIREFIGYLVLYKKGHLIIIGLWTLLYCIFILVEKMFLL